MIESFVCSICGMQHSGLTTDWAYTLPDAVWAIPEAERSQRARFDTDLCQFGERHFIRGVLEIPFTEASGRFGWGVWAEVEPLVFQRYLKLFDKDGTSEPRQQGALANDLPPYPGSLGASVIVSFRDPTTRPSFLLKTDDVRRLAAEQRVGISTARYHEVLARLQNH